MKFPVSTLAAAAGIALLAGCTSPALVKQQEEIEGRVPTAAITKNLSANDRTYGSSGAVERAGSVYSGPVRVQHFAAPWVGGLRTVAKAEDRLPAVFNSNFSFDFAGPTELATVAERLSVMTGVPVRVRSDVFAEGKGGSASAAGMRPAFPTPVPGRPLGGPGAPGAPGFPGADSGAGMGDLVLSSLQPSSIRTVDMRFDGRLRDFLDNMTAKLGLSWEYRDSTVAIVRLLTETYDVGAFPGEQNYSFTTGATGGGNSSEGGVRMSANNRVAVSQSGDTDIRRSILKTVEEIIADDTGASVTWADGSSRLVVVASKETQARVRDFVQSEQKALATMVNVTFDVYSVTTEETDTKGVSWSNVLQSLNQRYGFTFASPSFTSSALMGSMTTNYVTANGARETSAILNLLSEYGNAAKVRPISITTLNGQWDTKSRLSTDGYLKETTPGTGSTTGSAGAPGLKTDTITTGDQYAVMPYVQSDKSILVKYSISLSDLLGLFEVSTGEGESFQRVQTPKVEAINASSTLRLQPGQTAVITGLSRLVSQSSDNRLTRELPVVAGGSVYGAVKREHFMILVRATPL